MDRIILDTNLWISFLISKKFHELDSFILNNKVKLIFSQELLEEFITVINRPKFEKFFIKKDIDQLLELFDIYGELIDVKSVVNLCRDPKDNFLLSLATILLNNEKYAIKNWFFIRICNCCPGNIFSYFQ